MKRVSKWKTVLLPAALLMFWLPSLPAQQIARDGKACSEVVNENAAGSIVLEHAGTELALWLGKLSGAVIPRTAGETKAETQIYLGTPESSPVIAEFVKSKSAAMKKIQGNDGFLIASKGNRIYIAATKPKGVLNGVYRFLEQISDIIFVRPMQAETGFGTIYGSFPNLRADIAELTDVPVFKYRQFRDANPVHESRWLCAPILRGFWKEQTAVSGVYWSSEAVGMRATREGKEHPEFFAERNGKRGTGWYTQLCFTNPGLRKAYRDRLEELFLATPEKIVFFSVNHSDNWNVCECAECKKPITLKDGTVIPPDHPSFRTTQFFRFYDSIIRELEGKYPGRQLMAFAYIWSAPPPLEKISSRILVDFAPYVKDHKVPIYESRNKPWNEYAEGWLKRHDNIRVYEYYLCTTTPLFPNPVADVAAQDLRYYAKSGNVKGMLQDCTMDDDDQPYFGTFTRANVFDMSAIEYWIISRLYWNPELDTETLRDEFCSRAYRGAADPMRRFHRMIGEVWHKDPVACYWNDDPVMSMRRYVTDNGLTEPLKKLLAEAEAKADHPGSKELIRRQRVLFERLAEMESKLAKRTTVEVPYCAKVPVDTFDFQAGAWKDAGVIDAFRVRNAHHKEPNVRTTVKVLHDRENLYLAFDCRDEIKKKLDTLRERTSTAKDIWPAEPSIELFIDGDLRERGGYYHLAFNPLGSQYDARGYDAKYDNDKWTVRGNLGNDSWKALVTIPLSSIGRNITLGNRFGLMIFRPTGNASWMGGNVHQPGGFQELLLKMN